MTKCKMRDSVKLPGLCSFAVLFVLYCCFGVSICAAQQEKVQVNVKDTEKKDDENNLTVQDIDLSQVKVTLDYKNASLSAVLRSLSYTYGLNLVVTNDISGQVNISFKDVPLEEALQAILNVNGYAYKRKGKLVYITPGPGVEGIDTNTVLIRLNYLTAADAERMIMKVISSKGSVEINDSTNSLVITDFDHNVEKVREVLQTIDIPPQQVLIEAKIVDLETSLFENLGTTYSVDYETNGIFDRKVDTDEQITYDSALAGPSNQLSGGQFTITTTIRGLTTSMTIDALINSNKAHLLASPSIATLNGKEARIIIGEKFPYTEKTQTETGTTESTKFIDVGTTLRVTPLVSPDGWITLTVHPEVSSVSAALDAGPRITTREADATVRVRNGETIVIGGLISKQDDQSRGRVPLLGSIPGIKWLFSNRSQDAFEKELTVFLTPSIISDIPNQERLASLKNKEVVTLSDSRSELGIVSRYFDHVDGLQKSSSPESAYKSSEHRTQELINTYHEILKHFPNHPEIDKVRYNLGKLYYSKRSFKDAKSQFQILRDTFPESKYYKKGVSYLKKISAYQEKEKRNNEKVEQNDKSVFITASSNENESKAE